MNSRNRSSRYWQALVPLAALVLTPGCAILNQDATDATKLPEMVAEVAPQQAQGHAGAITLEIRPSGNRSEARQIPLTGAMRIQDVLDQTGLPQRFKRMDLYVMRVAGDQRHKLDSKYSYKSGIVNPLYDYSLRPGDHLVVIEDTRNMFDDMLGSLGGPVGRTFSR